ncbi:MAG: carboxypeptidase-like regulatory domain-containing protein [Acidobacteriia bacterium]|nr:carboxypeptidase-like regulatory domain-containing protein [Terriglobia bacterium]
MSEVVHLNHGRAQINFPYDPRFHGQFEVTAFAITGSEEKNSDLVGERQVLFPGPQELQLALRMAKAVLRPGEEAAADVGVRTPEGIPVESALGVLVYDRAVAERVRTDQQFGREYGFDIYDFLDEYYGQGIAGITYRDLAAWDSAKPFPDGLDLVAEAILAYTGRYESEGTVEFTGSGSYTSLQCKSVLRRVISGTTDPIFEALRKEYKDTERYARDADGLKEILKFHGLDFNTALDPWDVSYRAEFSVSGPKDVLTLISSGPNKRPGTEDDFTVLTLGWPYFRPIGKLINGAIFAYQRETGKYIRDYPTLRAEMKKRGTDLDALRDPWGRPYRFTFSIAGPYYNTRVTSAGPDGIFGAPKGQQFSDDVEEWSASIHYFADETTAIEEALALHYVKTGVFPQNDQEFKTVLDEANLTREQLIDPWGRPYHFAFTERSRYADQISIQTQTVYGQDPRSITKVTPVTQKVAYIEVLSDGEKADQPVRIMVAEFNRVTAEQDTRRVTAMPTPNQPPVAGGHGTIHGTVTDPQGAVIQNANVTVTSEGGVPYTATTDAVGSYEFTGLPTGFYQLQVEAQGFQHSIVLRIPVQQGGVTVVDVKLQVAGSMPF